jgi:diadenosine tetraphosphatase ApaH/serine/threonine PP2A family protein phosphatase
MAWLRKLNYFEKDGMTHFCHGSPVDLEEFEYIFSVEQAADLHPDLGVARADHVHRPLAPVQVVRGRRERVYEVVTKELRGAPGVSLHRVGRLGGAAAGP